MARLAKAEKEVEEQQKVWETCGQGGIISGFEEQTPRFVEGEIGYRSQTIDSNLFKSCLNT